MKIEKNKSLKSYNTFGIDAKAEYFVNLNTNEEIISFLKKDEFKDLNKLILGGGSNILFTKDFDGIVLKINNKGIDIVKEDENYIYIKAKAGENWEEFVNFCIENNYAGIENLSMIPGNVGAASIQNIGAYGVELKDVFFELEAVNIESGEIKTFSKEDCKFGYRYSVFKDALKNQYIILSVILRLNKHAILKTKYGSIRQELEKMGVEEVDIKAIGKAVCNIRSSKLPAPEKIGNAGSFFKNPVISSELHKKVKQKFNDLVAYKTDEGNFKLAAGWLIEQSGWKGKCLGSAGVHNEQALVLINLGNAKGTEILNLAQEVQKSVFEKFGVNLEMEVNVI